MNVGLAGVTLIEEFEGFPHGGRPYRDVVGMWTIGYGHTEGVSSHSPRQTEAQAMELLREDLDRRRGPVVDAIGVALAQHQFDALASCVYNCGHRRARYASLKARTHERAVHATSATRACGRGATNTETTKAGG